MLDNFQPLDENEIRNVNGGNDYPAACTKYVVKVCDSLDVIAQKYHTTVDILCDLNGILNPDTRLAPGKAIIVPNR